MKFHEIFRETSDDCVTGIFQYLRDEHREVYTASLSTLAQNRRLRPVFVQRKPAPEQIAWLTKNVRLRGTDEIGEHVLQLWLMKAHQAMLVQFLDGVGVAHDGEGAAEELPDSIDKKKLAKTVEKLLQDHDAEAVRIYLHVFQKQRSEGWEEISELIGKTPALQFGAEPETPEPKAPVAEASEEE